MSSQDISHSQREMSTQNSISDQDNFTLAGEIANISTENAVVAPSLTGSVHERHVIKLTIAYNEMDVLVKSLSASHEVAGYAKLLYSEVYNFSDFEELQLQHNAIVAACVHIACGEKNQQRAMPEVFRSSHATTQQMLIVSGKLKDFFATPLVRESLLSEEDKRLQSAYDALASISDPIKIAPIVVYYAKRLCKKVCNSGSFKDEEESLTVPWCLLIASRQLNDPRSFEEIFTILPGATKADMGRTGESLKVFFAAEDRQETTEASQTQGTIMGAGADARSTGKVVRTLQELIVQLNTEEDWGGGGGAGNELMESQSIASVYGKRKVECLQMYMYDKIGSWTCAVKHKLSR